MGGRWSEERELQVLDLFRKHRRGVEYIAQSRCPHDGRLLGAVQHLPDGLWVWQAGSRLSPSGSRIEVESWFLDALDESEFCSEAFRQASEYVEEELPRGCPVRR